MKLEFPLHFHFFVFVLMFCFSLFCIFISCIISCWRPQWRSWARSFNAANSFKPWKKNFLAECLKCESMSRPTDHLSSQLEVEHNKHLIWLSIMIVKWTLFIDHGDYQHSKQKGAGQCFATMLSTQKVSTESGNFSHPRNFWTQTRLES